MRKREPIQWPIPRDVMRVQLELRASAAEIGALPEPQRSAFMRGVGLVMAAANGGRSLSERRPSGEGQK